MRRKRWRRTVRVVRSYCSRNWLLIVAACYAQFEATIQAILARGRFAAGGEMLALPAILVLWEAVRVFLNRAISRKDVVRQIMGGGISQIKISTVTLFET